MNDEVTTVRTAAFGRGIPGASTQGLIVPANRRLLFTTGVVARDADGNIIGTDMRTQTERVFQNLGALLAEAGATFGDVVSATIYLTNMDELEAMREVRARYWQVPPPVMSTVEVSRLFKPGVLIEMQCVVALPG